jgi:hypothetical protein
MSYPTDNPMDGRGAPPAPAPVHEISQQAARALLASLREVLPRGLGTLDGTPDHAMIPANMSAGEIRRGRAAIALAEGG